MRLHKVLLNKGFTLVELLVTLVITGFITIVAFNFLVSQLEINARSEAYQRQRKSWATAAKLIEAEVSLSESIVTDIEKITLPVSCQTPLSNPQFKFALNIRRDLYQSIYFIADSATGWFGDKSLWRCGPSFDERGQYISVEDEDPNTPVPHIIIDGISPDGFSIDDTNTNGKLLTFTLSVEQDQLSSGFEDTISATTRNNPLYSRPNSIGLCEYAAGSLKKFTPESGETVFSAKDFASQVEQGQNLLLCGIGQVNTINGSSADDLIEAGGINATTIYGCNGGDVIEGTSTNDTIYGDNLYNDQGGQLDTENNCPTDSPIDGNDILIGNGNSSTTAEVLNGGGGFNQYVPGYGNFTIIGGNNLDIVYLSEDLTNGVSANYTFDTLCTSTACTVTDNTDAQNPKQLNLSGVEILIFRDQRLDLD